MKVRRLSYLFLLIYFSICTAVKAMNDMTLQEIQKGVKGKKSWIVLTFDRKAGWLGIIKDRQNCVSFFVKGNSGRFNDSVVYLSSSGERRIQINQMDDVASIVRFDVYCYDNIPLSIIRRNNYIIVSIESEKMMNINMTSGSFANSGRLINILSADNFDNIATTLKFEGNYDWAGYVRFSSGNDQLLISNAILLTSHDEYAYDNSPLKRVGLSSYIDQYNNTKVSLSFVPFHEYSIFNVKGNIVIKTKKEKGLKEAGTIENQGFTDVASSEDKYNNEAVDAADAQKEEISIDELFGIEEKSPEKSTVSDYIKKESVSKELDNFFTEQESKKYDQQTGQEKVEKERVSEKPQYYIPWDTKVSAHFRSTPLKDALRTIAGPYMNILINEQVDDSVTLNLSNVTLRQAFEKIVNTHNCEYYIDEGIVIVKPVRVVYRGGAVTKVYRLNYVDADNVAKVIKSIASEDSLVQVFQTEFLNPAKGGKNRMEKNEVAIQGIRRSSTIVVTDRPEKIDAIDRVIEKLDIPPVLFEIRAKLVETSPLNKSKLGINWDKTIEAILTDKLSSGVSSSGGAQEERSGINTNPGSIGSLTLTNLTTKKYQAVLDFLEEKTDSKLISHPRIMGMDNDESSISVGTTVPIAQIQRGMGGQGDMVTFQYKEVNIQLNVTPHLGANGDIIMYVNPVIEEIVDWVTYGVQEAPVTSKRTVNTVVTVKEGNTVVIGGLVKSKRIRVQNKVWLLGSIPLIGKLFQHETYEDVQSDVLIFITPRVIRI